MPSANLPIIDSHIHLYAQTHLSRLAWTASLSPDDILNRQSSITEYRAATHQSTNLRGFVFVETDRISTLDESGWIDPLDEVAFLARIARGRPVAGEGHIEEDSKLLLGIVSWAPVPAGPDVLAKYLAKVRQVCGDTETWRLVKGFRYLVQDKPTGTVSAPDFVAGLKWLGDQGLCFDLGVDMRQGGVAQLHETSTMLRDVFGNGDANGLKVVINHFCKPDLRSAVQVADYTETEDYKAWASAMRDFAGYPTTYMKLSGFFSELQPQPVETPTPIVQLVEQTRPFVAIVLAAFGPRRVMFGSDWPVCSAGGPGSYAWQRWVDLVTAILDDHGLSDEEKRRVWSETAMEAYGIDV